MSTTTVNGGDPAKSIHQNGPKAAFKGNVVTGKTLDNSRKQASPQPDTQNRKPWQGPHPFAQRNTNGNASNDRAAAKPVQPSSNTKGSTESQPNKHAHDRSIFLFANLVGRDVKLAYKSGEVFSGVFSGFAQDASNTAQYRLKMVRRERTATQQSTPQSEYIGDGEEHSMAFDVQDTLSLSAQDVPLGTSTSQQNGARGGSFLTDTQISGREGARSGERELQRWEPGPESLADMSLGDSGETGWDQFAANEKSFGVRSDYDESIYTTAINRNNPDYRRRQAEADRIAREIEGSAPANAHVAEERRAEARQDDAGDEEDKYSGVRRESVPLPKRAAGAYVPPSQRAISNMPTVAGAPFDPAIISSHISKPQPQPATLPREAPVPIPEKAVAAANEPQAAPSQPSQHTTTAGAAEFKNGEPLASSGTESVAKERQPTATGNLARDTADAFKQFANEEKLRMRQQTEAKKMQGRAEKNVKLNDLKKFAANFKLKSRVPDDLVPILAKDREKQLEIQSKAEEAAKEEELRAKEKGSEKASPSPAATSIPAGAGAKGPIVDPRSFGQHPRARASQQGRGGAMITGQGQSPRAPLSTRIQGNNQYYQQQQQQQSSQRQPGDMRMPSVSSATGDSLNPNANQRLNVNAKAFEFRPGASAFAPSGTSPSPQRISRQTTPHIPFFDEEAKKTPCKTASFDTIERLSKADYADHQKKQFASNGGFPQSYTTPPTWATIKANDGVSYLAAFQKSQASGPGGNMHASHGQGQMPPNGPQALPMHMGGPGGRQMYPQQMGHPGQYNHFQQQFGPHGPVQNSPRQQPIAVAPFNGQMAQMPFPQQPMPGYGMSPSMPYRQLQPTPMMMMPGQQQGQMNGPMRPGYPPVQQYPGGPQMGGHMMVQQPSSGGYSSNGPPSGFSPMPPHAQPHMPNHHLGQHQNGFSGSPRPPMMQHQGSHQGFSVMPPQQQQMPYGSQGPPPPQGMHGYHMGHRTMSNNGYPPQGQHQGPPMGTPRSHNAMPYHQSPAAPSVGMPSNVPAPQGEDGK